MTASRKPAVALISGGMDSAVVLAIAREAGFDVHALSVRYGQRHTSELDAADRVSTALGAVAHKTVTVDLRSIGGSSLTADIAVPTIPVKPVDTVGAGDTFCGYLGAALAEGMPLEASLRRAATGRSR